MFSLIAVNYVAEFTAAKKFHATHVEHYYDDSRYVTYRA